MTIRMTKKREAILAALRRAPGALSATELHQLLPTIDLVTIYRNLDLFTKEKLIKQLHLTSGEAQYEFQREPHHHAICTDCKRIIHFTAPDKKILQLLGVEDFTAQEIEVTVRGICRK